MELKKRKETMEKTKVVPFPSSEWMEELDFRKDGTLKATIYNYATVLENDPIFQCIRKDVLTGEYCAEPEGEDPVYGTQNTVFFIRMQLCKKYRTDNAKLVSEALNELSRKKPEMEINPIKDYLESLEWDGKLRLASVMEEYFGVQSTALNQRMLLAFMVSAVHRAIEPGCKNDYCLIIVGAQGMGKSLFVKKIGKRWGSDTLDSIGGKESYQQMRGKWIIELAEMEQFDKATVKKIKSFLAKCMDTYRPAYGRITLNIPRCQAFIGTTNDEVFLEDPTGSRRFFCLHCDKQKQIKNPAEMTDDEVDQLWAEAYHLYIDHYSTELTSKEQGKIEANNKQFTKRDYRIKLITQYLDIKLPKDWKSRSIPKRREYIQKMSNSAKQASGVLRNDICIDEVLCECLNKKRENIQSEEVKAVREMMKEIPDWEYVTPAVSEREEICKTKRFGPYGVSAYFRRIPPVANGE